MSTRRRVAGRDWHGCFGLLAVAVAMNLVGCSSEVRPEVVAGIDACQRCNMIIDQVHQACGYVLRGEFATFDSPACLLGSYEGLRKRGEPLPAAIFFADYRDGAFHPAEATSFLLTDHVPTVMNGRVVCFGSREAAEAAREHPDEDITDWVGYRTARGEPDKILEVSIGDGGMSPEVVAVAKGDLVLWKVRRSPAEGDRSLSVKGYPELGSVKLPEGAEEVAFRLLATRPGAGFPVVWAEGGEPLGMLKVAGSHTKDEEEQR